MLVYVKTVGGFGGVCLLPWIEITGPVAGDTYRRVVEVGVLGYPGIVP